MNRAIAVTRGIVGITGVVQLVLGIVFWTGHAMALVPLHMILGMVFVVGLLTQSVLSARAGAPVGLAVTGFVWGLLLAALGMTQVRILPGPGHWIIRVLHLLTAVVAMGLANALAMRAGAAPAHGHREPVWTAQAPGSKA